MLQQCGQYQSSAYPCSCGVAYGGCGCGSGGGSGNSYTFLFPVTGKQYMDECSDTSGSNSYSTSLVDCTLSLGTPSTRQTENRALAAATHIQQPSSMSNFCWDVISQSKNSSLGPNVSTGAAGLGSDPLLLARRCANCDTTSTPLWRNGPRGPKSLCNACGIRYKKEERRAAASMVPPSPSPAATEQGIGSGYHRRQQQTPWSCYSSSAVKSSSSFAMYNDVTDNGDAAAPYLSWQFSIAPSSQMQVQDRPSLFQYN